MIENLSLIYNWVAAEPVTGMTWIAAFCLSAGYTTVKLGRWLGVIN